MDRFGEAEANADWNESILILPTKRSPLGRPYLLVGQSVWRVDGCEVVEQ